MIPREIQTASEPQKPLGAAHGSPVFRRAWRASQRLAPVHVEGWIQTATTSTENNPATDTRVTEEAPCPLPQPGGLPNPGQRTLVSQRWPRANGAWTSITRGVPEFTEAELTHRPL